MVSVRFTCILLALAMVVGRARASGQGIGVVIRNNCGGWQRVQVGLVGGPPSVRVSLRKGQEQTRTLCGSPSACGYADGTWDDPKAHWMRAVVETQQGRAIEQTLTASSSGAMRAMFVVELC